MNKILRYSLVVLMAMVMGKAFGQEVTLDFTLADADNSKVSVWGFPAGSSNKLVEEKSFTYGDYTVKVAASEGQGYYWHDTNHYLLFGKQGATLTLPAFSFDVERLEIEGNSGASTGTKQNIFVGGTAVSTETTGAQGTNIFDIAANYQAAGNIYVIKVTSNHNNQIKTIKIWKKGTSQTDPVVEPQVESKTVAEALAIINGLEDGKTTAEEYQVKGFVVGAPEFQRDNSGKLYGNVNLKIADEKGGSATLTVYRGKNLENQLFTEETISSINENDEVVFQGKLQKYVKNDVMTPELTNGYVIAVNSGSDDPAADTRVWDFTKWSEATISNLKADAAAGTTNWSNDEKNDGNTVEGCYWYQGSVNEDGSISANSTVIEELKGLKFNTDYAAKRSLAIAINYPTALISGTEQTYAGGAYLWLGGGGSKQAFPCFTIPGVKAGSKIAVELESHKNSDGRGIGLYKNSYDAANLIGEQFKPTTKDVHTWEIAEDCDVVVWNTSGCHIYNIKVESTGGSETEPILTLKGKVGEEVSLTFGVYETEDTYSVDFGDGNLQEAKVGIDNKGPVQEDGTTPTATTFKGTVAGDGTIKVYGKNDIWYYLTSGDVMPTSFDQAKLMNVVQMSITGANVESVALPAYEKMTQFSFNNSPVKTVDVSKVTTLTNLSIFCTTQSAFEPQLETIDLSKNVNLDMISLGGNYYKKGVLKALDLTNNTKLTHISAENNKIATVTGIPVTAKNIYLSNNELSTLTFPELTTKGTIQIQNNKFTLATLPTKPTITSTSKYTYAPQPAYKVNGILEELDLSSQLTATGVLTESATTTFSFVTASGTALVEGTDYEVTAPGKFKFLKKQDEKIHGVMATEAFPKFTGANAYVTTEFTIGKTNAATFDFENNNGNWTIGEGADFAKGELKEDNPIAKDDVKLTGIQGTATTAVRYFTNASKGNCLWIFKNNSIKLSAPQGMNIVKVAFTMQTGSFDLTPSTGEVAENVWTGEASEVTFGPNGKGTRYVYAIKVTFAEDPTAVKSIQTQKTTGKIYNLQGVEVKKASKGMYIQNGKVIIVK